MIAFVRLATPWAPRLEANPALKSACKLFTGQRPYDDYLRSCGESKLWTFHDHRVAEQAPDRARKELIELFTRHGIRYALVTQKLLWYSDVVEKVCVELGIQLTWCEVFFDTRIIMDRTGLQYCRDNELKFETAVAQAEPLLPKETRLLQPNVALPDELRAKLDAVGDVVVVLGQVPHDMALREYPGLSYPRWLDALFAGNPDTRFLFKHHPQAPTEGLGKYANVRVINEHLDSLWNAFQYFASFSSTTIFEGMIRGKVFATGGYHFCSGLTLPVHTVKEAVGLLEKLKAYQTPAEAWARRLSFVCNHYTIPLSSPRLWERMFRSSEAFFGHF